MHMPRQAYVRHCAHATAEAWHTSRMALAHTWKAARTDHAPLTDMEAVATWPCNSPTSAWAALDGNATIAACTTREPCACIISSTTRPRSAVSIAGCAAGKLA